MGTLGVCDIGQVEYREAYALQGRVHAARQAGEIGDTLLLVDHPPVLTRGRRTEASELPMGESWYLSQGIDVVDVDRGGRLTYHGPGQLVGYAIMGVTDVLAFVRTMEGAIVTALEEQGLQARARPDEGPDFTGVWVEDRKIASIGIHVARGVATHGFAINADNDLQPFTFIVPCGLPEVQMTSLSKETGRHGTLPGLREAMVRNFAAAHGLQVQTVDPDSWHRPSPGS